MAPLPASHDVRRNQAIDALLLAHGVRQIPAIIQVLEDKSLDGAGCRRPKR